MLPDETVIMPDCFIVRSVETRDIEDLYALSCQASLVSLPPNRTVLQQLIDASLYSFAQEGYHHEAVYVFVLEDLNRRKVIGESLVHAGCAAPEHPYYFFHVREQIKTDRDLQIEVRHPVLRLGSLTKGASLCGGLILDQEYHTHPARLGTLVAFLRFVYMAMSPERFEKLILSEVDVPLTADGRNLFWEVLGKPFTGLSYEQSLELNRQNNMGFVVNLFPPEDIYLCLVDPAVHPSAETGQQAARRIITKAGFRYQHKIHFHGGPIYGVTPNNLRPSVEGRSYRAALLETDSVVSGAYFIGTLKLNRFIGGSFPACVQGDQLFLAPATFQILGLHPEEILFACPDEPDCDTVFEGKGSR